MAAKVMIINPKDNVAIALQDLEEGDHVRLPGGGEVIVLTRVPYSHKLAVRDILKGQSVFKYGEVIGEAKEPIRKGEWVHTHNLDIDQGLEDKE